MKAILAALVVLGLGIADANGQCYRRSYYYPPAVQKVVEYVQPVVNLAYYQVPVALYAVSYQPAQYSSTFTSSYQTVAQSAQAYATPVAYAAPVVHQSCEEKVSLLKLRLEQIEQRLTLAATPPPATSQTQPAAPGAYQQPEAVPAGAMSLATNGGGWQAILKNKCAACHSAEKMDPTTQFMMFQGGKPVAFSTDDKLSIIREIGFGRMPKKNSLNITALTEAEHKEVFEWATKAAPVTAQPPPPPAPPAPNGK